MTFSFTLQPILLLLGRTVAFLWSIIVSLWRISLRLIFGFFGYRPQPIFAGMEELWIDFFFYGDMDYLGQGKISYRSSDYLDWDDYRENWYNTRERTMLTTGIELTLLIGPLWLLIEYWKNFSSVRTLIMTIPIFITGIIVARLVDREREDSPWSGFLPVIIMVVFWSVARYKEYILYAHHNVYQWIIDNQFLTGVYTLTIIIMIVMKKIKIGQIIKTIRMKVEKPETKIKAEKKKVDEDLLLKEWLKNNLHVENKPVKVELDKVPVPPPYASKLAQKITIKFWAAKIAVCKPFAR